MTCFRTSLELYHQVSDPWGEAILHNNMGALMEDQGDFPAAQAYYQTFFTLAEQVQDPFLVTLAYLNLGALNRRRVDLPASQRYYEKALERATEMNHIFLLIGAYHDSALLARQQGDLQRAISLHWSGLYLAQKYGDRATQIEGLDALAVIATQLNQDELAARLLGTVERVRQGTNLPRQEAVERLYQECQQTLQNRLGLGAYASHRLEGRSQEIEEALNQALTHLTTVIQPNAPEVPREGLTRRELEIAALVAQGKSNEEIALELVVVVKTVEKHISSILRKLGFRSQAEIAVWEVKRGQR